MTVSLAQHKETSFSSGTTNTVAYASSQTAGDVNAVVVISNTTGQTTTGVSDGTNGNYTKVASNVTEDSGGGECSIWVKTGIAGGAAPTVSITTSSAAAIEVAIMEWSGVNTLGPTNTQSSTTGATMTSGSVNNTVSPCVTLGGFICGGNFSAGTSGGYTDVLIVSNGWAYQIFSGSVGSTNPQAVQTSGVGWDGATATLYKSSSGLEEYAPAQGGAPGLPPLALILAGPDEFVQQPVLALEELQPWAPTLPLVLGMPAPVTDEELPQPPPPPGALEEYAPPPLLFALGPWTMPRLVDEELAQPPPPTLVDEEYSPPLPPLFALTPPVLFAFDEEVAWQQVFEDYLPPLVFPAIVWAQSGAFYEQEFAQAPTTVAIEEYAPGQQIAAPLVAAPPFTVFIPEQEFVQFVPPIVGSVVVDSIGVGHYIGLGHV